MISIAILTTGDPISSVHELVPDFATLIRNVAAVDGASWQNFDIRNPQNLPDPHLFAAYIITGSRHSVTEFSPWMAQAAAHLRRIRDSGVGLFGICFGHQLMAWAFGGVVAINPQGYEVGCKVAQPLPADGALPWPTRRFAVPMCHRDTVVEAPRCARVLAVTDRDSHAALHYGNLCYSTQFHPEFTPQVLTRYVEHFRATLHQQGDDVDSLLAQSHDTPVAAALLHQFIRVVSDGG